MPLATTKGGLVPTNFWFKMNLTVPPHGTGAAKVGGNYAASLLPGKMAKSRNFRVIYLDPATHTKIEEAWLANFFGITADNEFSNAIASFYLTIWLPSTFALLGRTPLGLLYTDRRWCLIDNLIVL